MSYNIYMGVQGIIKNRRLYLLVAMAIATFGILGYGSFAANQNQNLADAVVASGRSKLNSEYNYGAAGEDKFDSSGLIYWAYEKQNGLKLGTQRGTTADYFKAGQAVAKENLKKGDLVFFSANGSDPDQVGIYIGSENFIQASGAFGKTVVTSFNTHLANPNTQKADDSRKTYGELFLVGRRVIGINFSLVQINSFKIGDEGTEVQVFQTDLNTAGYHVETTGVYDSGTEAAVKSLQTTYGIEQSGIADSKIKEIVTELRITRTARLLMF